MHFLVSGRGKDHSRERDLRIDEKHFRKGDDSRAKKVLLHCVRYLELGAQLRENGKITDYTTASSHQAVILGNSAETWVQLRSCSPFRVCTAEFGQTREPHAAMVTGCHIQSVFRTILGHRSEGRGHNHHN